MEETAKTEPPLKMNRKEEDTFGWETESIVNTRKSGTDLKSFIGDMDWSIKLASKEIALQKVKQEKSKMDFNWKVKMKAKDAALARETETRERLEKQMVEERKSWQKYCEDLEKQLGEK